MKFFILLALVALASAKLNYNYNGQNAYGNLLSTGSYGLAGGYRSTGYTASASPLVLSTAAAAPVSRYGYAANAGYSTGLQLALVAAPQRSYAASAGYSQAQSYGPITAAIQSQRNVQVVDVPSTGTPAQPQQIVIGPSVQPLDFEFQSQSSPINVRQTHIPGQPAQPQYSSHQEEPDVLRQEVVKPIVHEVTEAIQPFRRVTQEVRPVQEEITQVVTRGQQQQQQVAYAAPAVQAQTVAVQALPVQTVAVAQPAVQTVAVAQPVQTIALAAQPVATTGYTTGYSSLNSFASRPSSTLALTGSTSYSRPVSSFSTETVSSADNYRK